MTNPYKDVMGRYRTTSLFKELNVDPNYVSPYTLTEDDKEGFTSAYKIYMSFNTEYEVAKALLGSWSHWQKLLACKPIFEYIEEWRKEKKEQLRSQGINAMISGIYHTDDKGNMVVNIQAAKWIAEGSFESKVKTKKVKETLSPQDHLLKQIETEMSSYVKPRD